MQDHISLFSSVLKANVENSIQELNYILDALDEFTTSTKQQNEIEDFISIICENSFNNVSNDNVLIQLGAQQPTELLHTIAQQIKDLIIFGNNNIFVSAASSLTRYNQGILNHQIVLIQVGLISLSKLILRILSKYKAPDAGTFLSRTGIRVYKFKPYTPRLTNKLLEIWANIFSIVSETDFSLISSSFHTSNELEDIANIFKIVKYIRIDHDTEFGVEFMSNVLVQMKTLKSKKMLNSSVICSVCDMFMSFPYNHDIYQSFIDFALSMMNDKSNGYAAVYLACTVYANMDIDVSKHISFFKTNVIPLIDTKPLYSLLALRYMMLGKSVDPKCYFCKMEEAKRTSPLAYVKAKTMPDIQPKDQKSFQSIFMSYYFNHISFSEYTPLIYKIIVHLAALDFEYFLNTIVPEFIDKELNSPEQLVLLMTIPMINHKDFAEFTKTSQEQINEFNSSVRNIVHCFMDSLKQECPQNSCIPIKYAIADKQHINQADLAVSETIDAWGVEGIEPINNELRHCSLKRNTHNNQKIILKSLQYIYNKDELCDKKVMNNIMKFIVSDDEEVSFTILDLVKNAYSTNDAMFHAMLRFILDFILQPQSDQEKLFMFLVALDKLVDGKSDESFTRQEVVDFDLALWICLQNSHPEIRLIMWRLTQKTSILRPFNIILNILQQMEDAVKIRIIYTQTSKIAGKPNIPDRSMKFNNALSSHYMDIWLYFITEIGIIKVQQNDEELKKRAQVIIPAFISMITASGDDGDLFDVAMITSFFACHVDERGAKLTKDFYNIANGCKFTMTEDFRPASVSLLMSLLSHKFMWCKKVVFKCMDLCHPFYLPSFFNILPNVNKELLPIAAQTMVRLIRSKYISKDSLKHNIPKITNFLTALQGYFVSQSINNPRVMSWNDETEALVLQAQKTCKCFCFIILVLINKFGDISIDDWPLSSREVSFRFLVNWASTKSELLSDLRAQSIFTIETLINNSQIFTDSYIFDDAAIRLIAENNSMTVMTNLLKFHTDILFLSFIDNCFLQRLSIAKGFFDAICECINESNINTIYKYCPSLIFLALVYKQIDYPKADVMIHKLLETYSKFPEKEGLEGVLANLPIEVFPQFFAFAVEGIFAATFHYINLHSHHIPPNVIIGAIRPFTKQLRFLPKQNHCLQETIEQFAYFTPYQFLEELMNATQAIDEDYFDSIMLIWKELIVSPDHVDIVPTFIFNYNNHKVVSKIISALIDSNTHLILSRLIDEIDFGHYFHITSCLGEDIENYMWITNIISEALRRNKELFTDSISTILHFALLFSDSGAYNLLMACCEVYGIVKPNAELTTDSLKKLVNGFSRKIHQNEAWGKVAIRWTLGTKSVKLCAISLMIYNQLMKTAEPLVVTGIRKVVSYHLMKSTSDINSISLLVSNAFEFYDNVFSGNEDYAFGFVASFMDCSIFFDSLYDHGVDLCIKTLMMKDVNAEAWKSVIKIIRPLLQYISSNLKAQSIIDELISYTGSDELMLAVAPIKEVAPDLFSSMIPLTDLLEHASRTTMQNVLSHYALMLDCSPELVINEIFKISITFLDKIKPDKCLPSLNRIYRYAIANINCCSAALPFIFAIGQKAPIVPTLQVLDFSDWNRSIEDVVRSLSKLQSSDSTVPNVTITDCKTISSVYNLLSSELTPKILPFATQKEMLEGIVSVSNSYQRKKISLRKSEPFRNQNSQPTRKSPLKRKDSNVFTLELTSAPLSHPLRIIKQTNLFTKKQMNQLLPSLSEFNKARQE